MKKYLIPFFLALTIFLLSGYPTKAQTCLDESVVCGYTQPDQIGECCSPPLECVRELQGTSYIYRCRQAPPRTPTPTPGSGCLAKDVECQKGTVSLGQCCHPNTCQRVRYEINQYIFECQPPPTPTPTPEEGTVGLPPGYDPSTDVSACGLAGVEKADQCCEEVPLNTDEIKDKLDIPVWAKILIPDQDLAKLLNLEGIITQCYLGQPDTSSGDCICKLEEGTTPIPALREICEKYVQGDELAACIECADDGGVQTAIGCIPVKFSHFITYYLFPVAIGLAGLIAFLCIIYSAFVMQTSAGDPERLKKARQNLTSCIVGLLIIIFSVFILQLIGVEILKIPGF